MAQYKPDFTAWFVLQGTIAAMHRPDLQDEMNTEWLTLTQPLSEAASKTRFVSRLIYNMPYHWQYNIGETVTNPGRLRHYYFRKKEIEQQVRTIIASHDITQLVVLGAGLDILTLRLAREYPDIRFIEIDKEDSQFFKQSTFAAHGMELPDNIELISGDLQEPLEDILKASSQFKSSQKTLWLAEGFLMFIPEHSVENLFSQIAKLSDKGSHILFTALPTDRQGTTFGRAMQNFYLKKEKSPFKWILPYEQAGEFVKKMGYKLVGQISCESLHRRYIKQNFMWNHEFAEDIHIAELVDM